MILTSILIVIFCTIKNTPRQAKGVLFLCVCRRYDVNTCAANVFYNYVTNGNSALGTNGVYFLHYVENQLLRNCARGLYGNNSSVITSHGTRHRSHRMRAFVLGVSDTSLTSVTRNTLNALILIEFHGQVTATGTNNTSKLSLHHFASSNVTLILPLSTEFIISAVNFTVSISPGASLSFFFERSTRSPSKTTIFLSLNTSATRK